MCCKVGSVSRHAQLFDKSCCCCTGTAPLGERAPIGTQLAGHSFVYKDQHVLPPHRSTQQRHTRTERRRPRNGGEMAVLTDEPPKACDWSYLGARTGVSMMAAQDPYKACYQKVKALHADQARRKQRRDAARMRPQMMGPGSGFYGWQETRARPDSLSMTQEINHQLHEADRIFHMMGRDRSFDGSGIY